MKSIITLFLCINVCLQVSGTTHVPESLYSIPKIQSVEERHDPACGKYYRCLIEQPCDHDFPELGTFLQQIYILHRSDSAAVVFVTTGGKLGSTCWSETADLLQANQVMIETRYCGESIPSRGINWNTLTMRQIASDIHTIIDQLKKALYTHNYLITTGNKQGGLEALFHARYHPGDVHQTILYNTPLCTDSPDKRMTRYQVNLGKGGKLFSGGGLKLGTGNAGFSFFPTTSELNYTIKDFQTYCLKNQDTLLPFFEKYCTEQGYTFQRVTSSRRALQLCILQYRPAFFSKAISKELIPDKDYDNPGFYVEHLVSVADPSLFCDSSILAQEPIAWLTLNETGYYQHYTQPFRKLLFKDISDRSYLYPPDMQTTTVKFRRKQIKELTKWVQHEARNIIFIYGLLDIHSAARIDLKKNRFCSLFVSPVQGNNCRMDKFDNGTYNYLKDLIFSRYQKFRK